MGNCPAHSHWFLKMLIVQRGIPVSAPCKAVQREQFKAQILIRNFHGEEAAAVGIGETFPRLNVF